MLQSVSATQSHQRLHLVFVQRTIFFSDALRKRRKGVFRKAHLYCFALDLLLYIGMALPEVVPHFERLLLPLQRRQQAVQA